jgi:hypothetical protein
MYRTMGDLLRADADKAALPLKTLNEVRLALLNAKDAHSDKTLARMMLRYGRMTEQARHYVASRYPQD